MSLPSLRLKKGEDRRIRAGHPWIYSNEIDTRLTPLKNFTKGEEVLVENHQQTPIGLAYVNPHSLICARLFTRNIEERLNSDFIKQRLTEALDLRERLFNKPYYRLAFSEGDRLPGLVIDRFNNDFVVQLNTAGMDCRQHFIVDALHSLFPSLHSILLRNDSPIRKLEGLENNISSLYGTPPQVIELEENSVRFSAPFISGQKTGWFYDHRMNRANLKKYVNERKVLDVFSYLGGFGIQAAVFGASQVDCIDASQSACDFIHANAKLNQVENRVNAICEDAFIAMKQLVNAKSTYDIVIVDPPAFVKKQKDRHEGLIAYQRINELALQLLSAEGILVSCSCSMHVSFTDLTELLQRAAYRTNCNIQIIERGHQGPDHPIHIAIPETDYLKAIFIRKIN